MTRTASRRAWLLEALLAHGSVDGCVVSEYDAEAAVADGEAGRCWKA